jgi:alpha-1,2-mannosyltransferase
VDPADAVESLDPVDAVLDCVPRRLLVVAPAVVAAGAIAVATAMVVHSVRGNPLALVDLSVYRTGGRAVLDGNDIYTVREVRTGLPFTYPAFAALLFVPLAAIGIGLGQLLFSLVSGLALLRVVWLVARAVLAPGADGRARQVRATYAVAAALLVLAVALEPVGQTFTFGQINLVLLWLVVEDLLGALPARLRGVGVGVAAGLKITPALFVVYLLVVRRWHDAARAAGAFAVTVALGFAVLPGPSWRYWTGIAYDARRVGGVAYAGNQSIDAVLIRLSSIDGAKAAWLVCAALVVAFALLTARALLQTGRELFAVTVVGVASLLASPVAWNHHWVWALLVVAALLAEMLRAGRVDVLTAALLVLVVAVFTSRVIWRVPAHDDVEYHWHGWQLLAGNAYVLCGLVVLLYAAWLVRAEFWPRRRVR